MALPTNYQGLSDMLDEARSQGATDDQLSQVVKMVKAQVPNGDWTPPVDKSSLGSTGMAQTNPAFSQPSFLPKPGTTNALGMQDPTASPLNRAESYAAGLPNVPASANTTSPLMKGTQAVEQKVVPRVQSAAQGAVDTTEEMAQGGIERGSQGVNEMGAAFTDNKPLLEKLGEAGTGAAHLLSGAAETAVSPILGPTVGAATGFFKPELQSHEVQKAQEALAPILAKIPPDVRDSARSLLDMLGIGGTGAAAEAVAPAVEAGMNVASKVPEVAGKALDVAGETAGKVAGKVGEMAAPVIEKGKQILGDYGNAADKEIALRQGLKETANTEAATKGIIDKIAPKLNIAEKRAAIAEQRVTKGSSSKLFGDKPDIVAPTQKVQKAAATISERIPGAAKMDEFTLHNAIDKETGNIATQLKPEMQKVNLKSDLKQGMLDSWDKLKRTQQDSVEFETYPGLKNMQGKFEKFVGELGKNVRSEGGQFRQKSLDDLWETRKTYDRSIPDKVKNATAQSSDLLQAQKDMWLENRKIFNDAIHDASDGLGGTSKKAFSDMSDLYTAMHNIASRGEVETKGTEGFITPKKALGGAVLLLGGGTALGKALN